MAPLGLWDAPHSGMEGVGRVANVRTVSDLARGYA